MYRSVRPSIIHLSEKWTLRVDRNVDRFHVFESTCGVFMVLFRCYGVWRPSGLGGIGELFLSTKKNNQIEKGQQAFNLFAWLMFVIYPIRSRSLLSILFVLVPFRFPRKTSA